MARFLPRVEINFDQTAELTRIARRVASGDAEREAEVKVAYAAREITHPLTPIITGSWRSSWAIVSEGDVAIMGVDPGARNPLGDEDPIDYAPELHRAGGISRSGHRRDVLNVVVQDYGRELQEMLQEGYLVNIGLA